MNILILTGSFGMGHNAAASAVAEKLGSGLEGSCVNVADLFSYAFNSRKYNLLFRFMIKRGKGAYNYVYRHTEVSRRGRGVPFRKIIIRGLGELIKETHAEVIVSTLWSCSKAVSEYKRLTGSGIPLITCITDVSSHSEWMQPGTDFYICAAPEVKDELVLKGIEPERVMAAGIPVRKEFETECFRKRFSPEKKILIMGGGLGLLPKSREFYASLDRLPNVKTTVITGNNVSLYRSLRGRYKNVDVLGFVEDVPKYMSEAELLITKPGGITVFEAIAAELPLMMFRPFLGQERRNCELVANNGMGKVLPADPKRWADEIGAALEDRESLEAAGANMHSFKTLLDEDALLRLLRRYERRAV